MKKKNSQYWIKYYLQLLIFSYSIKDLQDQFQMENNHVVEDIVKGLCFVDLL